MEKDFFLDPQNYVKKQKITIFLHTNHIETSYDDCLDVKFLNEYELLYVTLPPEDQNVEFR